MVQQKRLPSTKNTATVEKLLKDVVIPKLGAMPDEHSRKELSGYIIWGLSARHETLANLAMELFMKAFKQEYTDSPFYRWGLEKGQAEGREEGREEGRLAHARRTVLRFGERQFGVPADAATKAAIDAIADLARLDELTDRIFTVDSWEKLLAP